MGAPAIYGDLSEAASAAYAGWMTALLERAAHVMNCSCCNGLHFCCPAGIEVERAERAAWARWDAVRPAEVAHAS